MPNQTAYIKLVPGSTATEIQLQDVQAKLEQYREQTALTGKQLAWEYASAAFPYQVTADPDGSNDWFYLKGTSVLYKYIAFRVNQTAEAEQTPQYQIEIVLPSGSTHGDKSKANEFSKYLAKQFKGELHMFNGRVMFFNPRK